MKIILFCCLGINSAPSIPSQITQSKWQPPPVSSLLVSLLSVEDKYFSYIWYWVWWVEHIPTTTEKHDPPYLYLSHAGNEGSVRIHKNVLFGFMYSQKCNCAASLFPKQNDTVLSPNSTFIYLWAIYIFPGSDCLFRCSQIGRQVLRIYERSQTHDCRNWERGRAVSFLGIHKSDFRYSVRGQACSTACY